jgi:preprotein translocase subunit SecA
MVDRVRALSVEYLLKIQVTREAPAPAPARTVRPAPAREVTLSHGESARSQPSAVRAGHKVGRNEPCPCGSGKKYKKCCLAKAG